MSTFLAVAGPALIIFFATAAVTGVFGPQLPVAKPHTGRHGHGDRLDAFTALVRVAWLYAALWLHARIPMLPGCVVAASDPGDGPAPDAPPEGAGPLYARPGDLPPLLYFRHDGVIEVTDEKLTIRPSTDATGGASPYPAQTEPLAALREQMEPVKAARPFVVIAEKYLP